MDAKKMAQMINAYDNYTQYIESYRQEMAAIQRNESLQKEFNLLMQSVCPGYDEGMPTYLQPATEEKVAEWLKIKTAEWLREPPAWLKEHYEATTSAE